MKCEHPNARKRIRLHRLILGAVVAIPAIVLIGLGLAFAYLQLRPGLSRESLEGQSPSLSSEMRAEASTASAVNQRSAPVIAWDQLARTLGGADTTAIALHSVQPISLDGLIGESEWANAFEMDFLDPDPQASPTQKSVGILWNEHKLYISLAAKRRPGSSTRQAKWSCCTVVLHGSSPHVRCRFVMGIDASPVAQRLTTESCETIDPDTWQSAIQPGEEGLTAEVAISDKALGLSSFQASQRLSGIIQISETEARVPASGDPPIYWLLESTRGSRVDVVFLDQRASPWPPVVSANCVIDPSGIALQWDLGQVNAYPGKRIQMPVSICARPDAASHARVALSATVRRHQGDAKTGEHVSQTQRLLAPGRAMRDRVYREVLAIPPIAHPGPYEVCLSADAGAGITAHATTVLLVSRDWRRDLRRHLVGQRDRLEAAGELAPFPRSIAIAHVNGLLDKLEHTENLDHLVLRKVSLAEKALSAIANGHTPRGPTGRFELHCGHRSSSVAPFIVTVPWYYDDDLAWPVVVENEQLPFPNVVRLAPVSKAVVSFLPILKQTLNVDLDRAYIAGYCRDAYAATDCILQHPEPWAAGILILRIKWSPLWANARHVPICCYASESGHVDALVTHAAQRWMQQHDCDLEYVVCRGTKHELPNAVYVDRMPQWLLQHRRTNMPKEVDLTTSGYAHNRAYWVSVDAIDEQSTFARIWARIEHKTIYVTTKNVAGYCLLLGQAPLAAETEEFTIVENGTPVGTIYQDQARTVFCREPPGYKSAAFKKRAGMCGPIGQALSRPFVIVCGNSGFDPKLSNAAKRVADRIRGAGWLLQKPEVVSDIMLTEDRASSSNLLLLGTADSNVWIRQIEGRLPAQIQGQELIANKRTFDARRTGFILLYPNPLAPDHFVLLVSSAAPHVLEALGHAFIKDSISVRTQDVLVGELVEGPGAVCWHLVERFDWAWNWPEPGPILAKLNWPHPDWQWNRFITEIVRQRADADLFFAARVTQVVPADLTGPITARHIYRYVRNDWLVCAEMPRHHLEEFISRVCLGEAKPVVSGLEHVTPSTRTKNRPLMRTSQVTRDSDGTLRIVAPNDGGAGLANQGIPADALPPAWWEAFCSMAEECRLTDLCIADCVVQYLKANPGIDLDEVLSSQPRQRPLRETIPSNRLLEGLTDQ